MEDRQRGGAALGLAVAALVLVLAPVLRTGWLHDDAWNSTVSGLMRIRGEGFFEFAWGDFVDQVERSGRGLPLLPLLGYGTFVVLGGHVLVYKVWLVVLTAVSGLAFRAAATGVGDAAGAGWPTLALVAAVPSLQIRTYHDSLTAYFGLLQVVLVLLSGAVVLYAASLRHDDRRLLWGAAGVFAAGCLLYEMVPLLAAVFVAVGLDRGLRLRAAVTRAWPLLAVALVFVVVVMVERAIATPPEAYSVGLAPGATLSAFVRQLVSTLPLTFLLFDPFDQLPSLGQALGNAWLPSLAAGVLSGAAAWLAASRMAAGGRRPWWTMGALLLVPSAATAYVVKYQVEVAWGLGYIQVLVQAFAFGGLVAAAVSLRPSSAVRLGAALLVGASGAAAYASNDAAADVLVEVRRPRDAVERAFHRGLLDGVPDGAVVRIAAGDWFNAPFVMAHAGRRVTTQVGLSPDFGGRPCTGGERDVAVVVSSDAESVSLRCAGQ